MLWNGKNDKNDSYHFFLYKISKMCKKSPLLLENLQFIMNLR